jgi:ParB family chromosome partitioning protein
METTIRKGPVRGLGRGLNALFEDEEAVAPLAHHAATIAAAAAEAGEGKGASRRELPVTILHPGKFQPRKSFDDETLQELSESIREHGILQPLVVRPMKDQFGQFEIICGERRWRAAQKAQLHNVPVIVREMDDEQAMQLALIENLQREDLNAIDEAEGYQRLLEEFAHTQEKLAKAVGKSRSHVANMIRLLNLPASVRSMIRDGRLTAGHARALITAKDPEALARQVIAASLSVRETEQLAQASEAREGVVRKNAKPPKDVDTLGLEREMRDRLGMKVSVDLKSDGKAGTLKITFKNLDELDTLIQKLS